jgi:hypothetical protein
MINRLSYSGFCDISFIALGTISQLSLASARCARSWQLWYHPSAIKLISPNPEYDNLFIIYLYLYQVPHPVSYWMVWQLCTYAEKQVKCSTELYVKPFIGLSVIWQILKNRFSCNENKHLETGYEVAYQITSVLMFK